MIAWIIILFVLLLILALPVGIDAAYDPETKYLKLKLGPVRKTLLPAQKKPKKPKEEKPEPAEKPSEKKKEKKKLKLSLDDILTLAEIGLDALHHFRVHLSVDRIVLHYTAAAADPYAAVQQYGKVNAALGVLAGKAHTALKIRSEDVQTQLDLTAERPVVEGRIILTIQIWEILLIGICAGARALRWLLKKKRMERADTKAEKERSTLDGELEYRESDGHHDAEDP